MIGNKSTRARIWLGLFLALMATALSPERASAQAIIQQSGSSPFGSLVQDVSGGGPAQTWDLVGNHINFFLRDTTNANKAPFVIEANAPHFGLFLNTGGRLGLGTATPIASIDSASTDSIFIPAISLKKVAPQTPSTWDIFADSASFGLRDTSGSFAYPIQVQHGTANGNAIFIDGTGNVGMGIGNVNVINGVSGTGRFLNVAALGGTAPTGVCNIVAQGQLGAQNHLAHLGAPANQRIVRFQCSSGTASFHALNDNLTSYAVPNILAMKLSNGNVGLKVLSPAHPLHLASGAHCTAGGVWTNASSRELKQDIEPLTSEMAQATVRALQPVGYRYKSDLDDTHLGFIAEDVPDAVATKDRKGLASMDIVAALTKVVQDQDRSLAEAREGQSQDRERIATQADVIARQQQLLDSLTKRLADLEEKMTTK